MDIYVRLISLKSERGINWWFNNLATQGSRLKKKVLDYVASLLDMSTEELAELSYRNAEHLFSFKGLQTS